MAFTMREPFFIGVTWGSYVLKASSRVSQFMSMIIIGKCVGWLREKKKDFVKYPEMSGGGTEVVAHFVHGH